LSALGLLGFCKLAKVMGIRLRELEEWEGASGIGDKER
jgi:hypothetical protein